MTNSILTLCTKKGRVPFLWKVPKRSVWTLANILRPLRWERNDSKKQSGDGSASSREKPIGVPGGPTGQQVRLANCHFPLVHWHLRWPSKYQYRDHLVGYCLITFPRNLFTLITRWDSHGLTIDQFQEVLRWGLVLGVQSNLIVCSVSCMTKNLRTKWWLNPFFNQLLKESKGTSFFYSPVIWKHQCLWHWRRRRSVPHTVQVNISFRSPLLTAEWVSGFGEA